MPNSPKVGKPLTGDETNAADGTGHEDVIPSVFTFNQVPAMSAPGKIISLIIFELNYW